MSKDHAQEKTEEATQHRLKKALDDGKVSKSQELSSVAVISLGFLALYALGPHLVGRTQRFMTYVFSEAPGMDLNDGFIVALFRDSVASFFMAVGPFLVCMVVIGLLINVAQVGFRFSTKPLEPKFDKLNPFEGAKRFFKPKTFVELVRDTFKVALVCYLGYLFISQDIQDFFVLMDSPTAVFAKQFGVLALLLAMKISGALLFLALFDFAFQRHNYKKELRMTKQEVREENKDTQGNPEMKGRLRQVQREMARQRMMQDVKTADVIVTNPTHISVALKYDRETMDAPQVVAKGERLIALRIREIAKEHGVPLVENKPLARSLFKLCDIGAYVPAKLFKAVAEILAYVYQLKGKQVNV